MRGGLITAAMCSGTFSGGSTTNEIMFDRISKLPTVFAFDIADGWRCELCADSDPIECSQRISHRYNDNWSEEYTSTAVIIQDTKAFYLRFFNGSDLKMSSVARWTDSIIKWYESNGMNIGELKKTIITEYSDFGVLSVGVNASAPLDLPSISLKLKITTITNGKVETNNTSMGIFSYSPEFFYKNETDPNTYDIFVKFVKAVRKMSDEYNKTEEE